MRWFSCCFVAFALFFSHASSANSADAIEVTYRETPQQLYQQLHDSVKQTIFSSADELHRAALNTNQTDDELFENLYFLARLALESRVQYESKPEDATALHDALLKIANSDYQHAAALNIAGRYAGRINQQYRDTVSFNEQAINYIRNAKDVRALQLKVVIYDEMGVVNLILKRQDAALNNFKQMLEAATLLRNDYLIAEAEARLAKYYREVDKMSLALQHYTAAYNAASKDKKPYQTAMLEMNLAKLYRDLKQWNEALNHIHKAIELFRQQGDHKFLSASMTVIAIIYAEQGEWDKAIDYYLNAQQYDAKYQSLTAQALNFHNLGEAYFHIDNYNKALEYLLQANKIFRERNSNHYLVYNEMMLAQVAIKAGQFDVALSHAQDALNLAEKLSLTDERIEALTYLVSSQQHQGQYEAALNNQQLITQLTKEKLETATTTAAPKAETEIAEQNLLLKTQKQRTELQKQQNMLLNRNIVIGFLLMLLIGVGTYILYSARRRQHEKASQQHAESLLKRDPMFQLPGYRAFIEQLQQDITGIALLRFAELASTPLTRGMFAATLIQDNIYNRIKLLSNAKIYSIAPGVFALVSAQPIDIKELYQRLHGVNLDGNPLRLDLVAINLPLLADDEVSLPAEVIFETLQWMLAGAVSTQAETGCYLTIKVLEFTPSTVFSQPLYLQLAQAVRRGFIRIESNKDKDEITWPKFQALETSGSANIL
ncbi:tetratricopeptide repeat protein [Shewanella avicenniae]|uniref:Tetratricopeptide repeat protein n=1 Tax=Shewanella avicenniae TaxID=2814294 RepID=A0ABX7QP62_9GAMM|nr:tetratricopeptide repeat protein [Shewanella avicenniae]QSX32525.1 tetratricopeptide repeat protein [Shewanella avicenniae]